MSGKFKFAVVVVAVLVGEVGSFLGKTHEADTARALLLEHVTFYAMLPEKRAMNQPSVERGNSNGRGEGRGLPVCFL